MDFESITGQLYFKLQQRLGFGRLLMQSHRPGTISYEWQFTAKGQDYSGEYLFEAEYLTHCDLDYEAFALSENWKNRYRGVTK